MPTIPFAYNTGSSIGGTIQVGNLAVGTSSQDYSSNPGGVKWWMGPEDSTGFVIAIPVSGNDQPTPVVFEPSASVGFYRSLDLTDNSFISLSNAVFNQNFTNASSASAWLTTNGYWNSYTASAAPTSSTSQFVVNIFQSGSDVVWFGSGSFDLTGLTLLGSQNIGAGMLANQAIWAIGPTATVDQYGGASLTYTSSFGTPISYPPPSSSGSTFGILTGGASGRILVVPSGYISNTVISGSALYAGQTISGMGLFTGSYVWAWNSGSSSLTMNIG